MLSLLGSILVAPPLYLNVRSLTAEQVKLDDDVFSVVHPKPVECLNLFFSINKNFDIAISLFNAFLLYNRTTFYFFFVALLNIDFRLCLAACYFPLPKSVRMRF